MTDPGPPHPDDPLEPPDDPMLDALERSIEGPGGLHDPLADPHPGEIDPLGRMLGRLEEHLENAEMASPLTGLHQEGLAPDLIIGVPPDPIPPDKDLVTPEPALPEQYPSLDSMLPAPPEDTGYRMPPASPPLPRPRRGGGTGRRGSRRTHRGRITGRAPDVAKRSRSSTKYCPEQGEMVDESQCENCDKYRHWPEGADEHPKQCWHDWQASKKDPEDRGEDLD